MALDDPLTGCDLHAVMPTLSDLPDEVLDLILQHVVTLPPFQSDGNIEHGGDTFHRVADWYTLASVNSRCAYCTCMPVYSARAAAPETKCSGG